MIKDFSDFVAAYSEADYDLDEMSVSQEEYENIKKDIQNFSDEIMNNAQEVFSDWYGLKVPNELIKQILSKDFDLAVEVYTGGIGDTCQRELLIDSLLRYMKMRRWPTNMEGDTVFAEFQNKLTEKVAEFGIEMLP